MEGGEVWSFLKKVHFPGDDELTPYLASSSAEERKKLISEFKGDTHESRIAAAIEIQRVWRGHKTRKKLSSILKNNYVKSKKLALPLDSATPTKHLWREKEQRVWTKDSAATAIQKAWRRHTDLNVFKYFKELLNFNGKTDPRQMLKYINPTEAQLIDEATGGFIRFRLGGDKFPPLIYYKIFTHQSVVDMCSFSPRDYTMMRERRQLGRHIHNNSKEETTPSLSKDGWYQRIENNQWRAITDRSIPYYKFIESSSPRKPVTEFRHLKSLRREDAQVLRKRRKVQWMMKMYKEGMKEEQLIPAPCVTPSGGVESIVTLSSVQTGNAHASEPSLLDDKDIEELLQWTAGLDYDKYLDYWGELATSYIDNSTTIADHDS